ncbi:MAG: GTP-binding protein, partial [Lachnospiraceae bacterium]|nr:GTP-binding protein [Lachnospiraceae bacterium]
MKQLVAGILAHVDAGKTTLSEGILYLAGSIRKLGRVDHRDAHLDTDAQERNRGITIFSKPAELRWKELELTLIDTPGHVDFSAEMERALQVLDCAVLVISGTDGVQGHTETLWQLLARYRIPTFLFVNKMDLAGASRELRMLNLKNRLSDSCIEFPARPPESFYEELALCSEELLEEYMERGQQETPSIAAAIRNRQVFPVFFGSALKLDGVEGLLDALEKYCPERSYPEEFGAKVYKIGRDEQGKRLTWMKITGGSLRVREPLSCGASAESAQEEWKDAGKSAAREKVDQIRIYNGAKYRTVDCAPAGTICAVTGLTQTHPGQGLGEEISTEMTLAAPVMTWRLTLPA